MKRILFLTLVCLAGCGRCGEKKPPPEEKEKTRASEPSKEPAKERSGLDFTVTGEQGATAAHRPVPVAPATPLAERETETLLARLSPIAKRREDEKRFALRKSSLPPPRTVEVKKSDFPPDRAESPGKPSRTESKKLEVVRFSPDGEVDMAPRVSVTFSQPMVAVTSHASTVSSGAPLEITPDIKGQYRWLGTRTLLFEPDTRLPMATRYVARVPASAKSKLGKTLDSEKRWTFETPPPRVLLGYPKKGPHGLEPVFFLLFDQKVEPKQVLSTTTLRGNGPVGLRLAAAAEIAADEKVSDLVERAPAGRFVTLVPEKRLEPATAYDLQVGPNTPSAEGPLETKEKQVLKLETYEPLSIERTSCPKKRPCRPLAALRVGFNNALDTASIRAEDLEVTPDIPAKRIEVRGRYLYLYGKTRGRVSYALNIPAKLRDEFGQTLGEPKKKRFYFKSARPALFGPSRAMTVLDPSGDETLGLYSINHDQLRVRVYRVSPADWDAYMSYFGKHRWSKSDVAPPGELLKKETVKISGKPDELVETRYRLSPFLDDQGHGHLIVHATQHPLPAKRHEQHHVVTWVQATDLAIDGFVDHERMLAWVTRLRDGKPVESAVVSFASSGGGSKSSEGGVATLRLPEKTTERKPVVAEKSGDVAMLPQSHYRWGGGWARRAPPGEHVRWYVFDDRKLYRPKERVRVKGWVRLVSMGPKPSIRLLPSEVEEVAYKLVDPRGKEIGKGKTKIGEGGGFDFDLRIPAEANLGRARVELSVSGVDAHAKTHEHWFRIEEFSRPEFEVDINASEGPHLVGGHADFSVAASYFAGGPLPNAKVKWRIASSKGGYRPPNRDEFTFVGWRPHWMRASRKVASHTETRESRTDSRGRDGLRVRFDSVDPPRPMSLAVHATVTDVNRRTWTSNKSIVVHPSELYVGLKTDRYFVERGTPLEVEIIVTDLDGKLVSGRDVLVKAFRQEHRYEKDRWKTARVDPQSCSVVSAGEARKCSFKTDEGGTHVIEATVSDEKKRKNRTVLVRWVAGGKRPSRRRVKKEEVRLVPDKDEYAPGDKAEVLVLSPFRPAEGLLTIRRGGLVRHRHFHMDGPTTTLDISIGNDAMPGVRFQVDLVGSAPRLDDRGNVVSSAPRRPAYASGTDILPVSRAERQLAVEVAPARKRLAPGKSTSVELNVSDAAGKPVEGARLAVVAVDEAVLALTGYELADPLKVFYPQVSSGVSDRYLRSHVRLLDPRRLMRMARRGPGGPIAQRALGVSNRAEARGASPSPRGVRRRAKKRAAKGIGGGTEHEPIEVRKDFSPVALFVPEVRTDDKGRATVKLDVPDSLTRYRLMTAAVSGVRLYGRGEATVTVRRPLMARPSPPRFLSFGDRFELPVVVHNQTSSSREVSVAVRGANLRFLEERGKKIVVPANDRREVRFTAETVLSGTARFQVAAGSAGFSDGAEGKLPVWTPATTEAFATYGTIDEGGMAQPVKVPPDAIPSFGGLEISTSSTGLSALTDAVLYLYAYPFECAEQISSRVLAVAALRDVLDAFEAKGLPPPDEIRAAMKRDLRKLERLQNADGGFPFWRPGHRSWAFLSVHVAHALLRAKSKGFEVSERTLTRVMAYIKRIEGHIRRWHSERTRQVITAYSLYVRALARDVDTVKLRRCHRKMKSMKPVPLEGMAWLYSVAAAANDSAILSDLRKLFQNRVTETASTAHFRTSYDDKGHLVLHSSRRIDGVLLEGLIEDQPKSDLIPKIVRGLLAHRKRGRWTNTQENCWVLLALDKYFHTYEKTTPSFVAKLWLGERFAGRQRYRGRTTEKRVIDVDMPVLNEIAGDDEVMLTLTKRGQGRLYYRVGMRYAPKDLDPPPADHGFAVQRRYEPVDDPGDVEQLADGSWRIRAGARARVVVTMAAHSRRYHVALVDPLPAGLEPINPALRGSERAPKKKSSTRSGWASRRRLSHLFRRRFYRRAWFEHQNLRDERAEAFASLVHAGVHDYSYVTRAMTPGVFVVPPAKAEEMYHPETFGRSGGDRVMVK